MVTIVRIDPAARIRALMVALVLAMTALIGMSGPATAELVLASFLPRIAARDLVPDADAFGPEREDLPVAPLLRDGKTIGWAFVTSDFVGTTGYSGKPIHTLVAVDFDARVLAVKLLKHSEPIVLIGIPDAKI